MLTRADFETKEEVRWCPGCGDYSILAQMQKLLPTLGISRENFVFVSGIGCSSRFPYYMNTYGFHSIHGRAPAVATGIKVSNPALSVWAVTGDGDGLSIGGNHLMHAMRRNVDIKILLFNNRIYGLTKGQYSPTSEINKKTKSSPFGTIEMPINPICMALASEATFVARSIDIDTAHLTKILERAAYHKGVAFIEIYQTCNIFNEDAFTGFTHKSVRADELLYLENDKPLIFGKDKDKALQLEGTTLKLVQLKEHGITEKTIAVHDEAIPTLSWAFLLSQLNHPEFPVPVGVFRNIQKPTYDALLEQQIQDVIRREGEGTLDALLRGRESWAVE